MAAQKKTIELALQGGGAHGALTWGVLDRILEDPKLKIEGISGTSAGAMNAVVTCMGLAQGGREGARKSLHDFWKGVSEAGRFNPLQRGFWDQWANNWSLDDSPMFLMLDYLSRTFSPYELNPLDLNPLRDLVKNFINFSDVNSYKGLKVFVTATNVRTGQPRVFRQPELTTETLMASAALPTLYKAVEIDGEAYWDGGYMGNPALFPLVDECDARDLILVQINPFYRDNIPKTARDIINRINEITFNSSLLKELRSILLLKQVIDKENLQNERYRDMRIHGIYTDASLSQLTPSSKLNPEWNYLLHLFKLGYNQADQWLDKNFDYIGEKTTFDVSCVLQESIRPVGFSESKRK